MDRMNRRFFLKSALLTTVAAPDLAPLVSNVDGSVAIIGHTGSGNYGHGLDTLWLNFPGLKITGVADADEKGLSAAMKKLNCTAGFRDYKTMLKSVKPDLLCVAPRHIDQHHNMLLAGIAAGVKGIYVEKPFCRNLEEANEIVAASEKSGTKIALAHRNRYHPALPVVKKLIEEGLVGEVLEIRMRGKEDKRGGPEDLWVLGSHVLNLAPLFAGDLTACSATILEGTRLVGKQDVREGNEGIGPVAGDRLHARFESRSGIPVFFDSIRSKASTDANFGLQIIGNRGVVDIRIDTEPMIHFLEGNPSNPGLKNREWLPITSAGVGKQEPLKNINSLIAGHHAAVTDLLDAVRLNRQPLCSMYEGRAGVQAIMAIFESHCRNGQLVSLSDLPEKNPLSRLK
jgi:predicted dehydrogenase